MPENSTAGVRAIPVPDCVIIVNLFELEVKQKCDKKSKKLKKPTKRRWLI